MYDSEGEVSWTKYLHEFLAFLEDQDEFDEVEVILMLSHTLRDGATTFLTIVCTHLSSFVI